MSDFNDLVDIIHSIEDRVLLEDFLVGLTTESERKELPKRVDIIAALVEGKSQHEIASELRVGIATVTRGSKELAAGRFKIMREDPR